MKTTPKETAKNINLAISEINKVIESMPLLNMLGIIEKKALTPEKLNILIAITCEKYSVKEDSIRKIAGYKKRK